MPPAPAGAILVLAPWTEWCALHTKSRPIFINEVDLEIGDRSGGLGGESRTLRNSENRSLLSSLLLSSQMINSNLFFKIEEIQLSNQYLLVESKTNCNSLSNHGGREEWVRREVVKAWVHWRKVANPRATERYRQESRCLHLISCQTMVGKNSG